MHAAPDRHESHYDPVCGFRLDQETQGIEKKIDGVPHLFCSEWCAERFLKNPLRYKGEPLIKLRNIEKTFGEGDAATRVLRGVDLNIWEGDFVSLVGASGSGKSTVLNMIGNLDRPTAGTLWIDGRDVSTLSDEERAKLRSNTFGFVFQQYNLIPWLTALENVLLPAIFAGKGRAAHEAHLREQFASVDLAHRVSHRPYQLSGGEQQRVALLRSLVNDPRIILGDEPTGNLDSKTGEKILAMLRDLNKTKGKTLVIVTHDAEIANLADHIIVLKDGRVAPNHRAGREMYTG